MLGPRRSLRKRRQQRQALRQVLDRFWVGRALQGLLSSPLPVGNGLRTEPRLGVMLRHQFGLALSRLRKPRLQDLRNTLVILLARAPQQGLIRGVLDERVFEHVGGLGAHAALVH